MHTVHAAPARSRTPGETPMDRRSRGLALRERAVLRLASRQGAVSITVRQDGLVIATAYERLNLLAELSERGLLRYAGVREDVGRTDIVYEL